MLSALRCFHLALFHFGLRCSCSFAVFFLCSALIVLAFQHAFGCFVYCFGSYYDCCLGFDSSCYHSGGAGCVGGGGGLGALVGGLVTLVGVLVALVGGGGGWVGAGILGRKLSDTEVPVRKYIKRQNISVIML